VTKSVEGLERGDSRRREKGIPVKLAIKGGYTDNGKAFRKSLNEGSRNWT